MHQCSRSFEHEVRPFSKRTLGNAAAENWRNTLLETRSAPVTDELTCATIPCSYLVIVAYPLSLKTDPRSRREGIDDAEDAVQER